MTKSFSYVIDAFGASVDSPDNAAAIQGAVNAAARAGGGRVVVPPGFFVPG